jgi:hypothetical protein
MFSPRLSSFRRYAPAFLILGLVGCKGGGGSSTVAVISEAAPTGGSPSPAPVPAPSPAPSETPSPTPTATTASAGRSIPADSLSGMEPIASGLDVSQFLVKSWGTGAIPGLEPGNAEGAFRFICVPSHNAYDDPIVYPGQPGKAHLHTFFGNTKADANSTYRSLRTSGESTCNNLLNRSAYWIPAMMNGRGQVVMPNHISIYYKRRPASDPLCTTGAKACLPLPHGLRYIFGHNMADGSRPPVGKMWWNCDGPGAVTGWFDNIPQAAKGCPVGAKLGAVIIAPDCWNGTELDSPDHRSHMAYMQKDQSGREFCPASHPYLLPAFQLGAWYATDATLDRTGNASPSAQTWHLSSDRMPGMANAVPGTTLHADWFGAWEDQIQTLWTANCINKRLNCSGGDLGNGQQMDTLAGYKYPVGTQLVDVPDRP